MTDTSAVGVDKVNNDGNRSLRILVVTECFWPDIYAINDIVEKLVKRGHRVTVLTGLPDYTTTEIPPEYRHGQNRHQNYKGADVYRVQTIARHHGPIWRSLSYLSFVVAGWMRAKRQDWKHTDVWGKGENQKDTDRIGNAGIRSSALSDIDDADFDVIYVWEVSPVTMAVPAIALKKRYKKPLFLYCMDIWPECVKAMSIKEGTLPFKLIHWWTKKIYRQCDHIAVSSKPFFDYLERVNGVSRDKMSYLPQYADVGLLELDTDKIHSDKNTDQEETTDFLFIGNIGKAQNLDCLMKAMTVFKGRTDVCLHMVGGGSELENIQKMARDLGIADIVKFYGPKPFKEAVTFYNKADACVLTLDGTTHIGDTLPGKLQTYMAAGKTILAAANGAAMEVIEESGCGKCVAAGDSEAYGQALLDYVDFKEKYANCGEKARQYFRDNFMEEQHYAELEYRLTDLAKR
ncbi:glycosyltransferase family 4 protein [Butyrivibrio proteoclasticus]|uniref:glycosyltransferase family 4 protein n=1 Tax=Butyrivibrio proteoclasticus TaxID=43305 RepID=UPI00047EF9ED|nr:glycosyltransferase family 4 protein [Butyrivibrio proteoclasticus]